MTSGAGFAVAERFNSRASCEARRQAEADRVDTSMFQFTRLLRGATPRAGASDGTGKVSIHAPLARRDIPPPSLGASRSCFNSRASCEARRGVEGAPRIAAWFQFTRLLRGATGGGGCGVGVGGCFNSRASCEARPGQGRRPAPA